MESSFVERIQMLSVQFVPFILAVVSHEFAHGYVARHWGDTTAEEAGRLTLNPIPHIDPIGTLLFPIINMLTGIQILFGWANPVPINPNRFRKYRPALFWVSFAGPAMNFLLAILSAALFCTILRFMPNDFYLFEPLAIMAKVSVSLNFALGIFNLIPLPPLDGSKIIESFLSLEATRKYEKLSQYSFFILLALLMTGALSVLEYPIRLSSGMTLWLMARAFGISELDLFL